MFLLSSLLTERLPGGTQGRVKLMVLSEDRLQIKWKEADGPVQGYKVHVRALSGETLPSAGSWVSRADAHHGVGVLPTFTLAWAALMVTLASCSGAAARADADHHPRPCYGGRPGLQPGVRPAHPAAQRHLRETPGEAAVHK